MVHAGNVVFDGSSWGGRDWPRNTPETGYKKPMPEIIIPLSNASAKTGNLCLGRLVALGVGLVTQEPWESSEVNLGAGTSLRSVSAPELA